jgi:hypothetical protein
VSDPKQIFLNSDEGKTQNAMIIIYFMVFTIEWIEIQKILSSSMR